MAILNVSYNKEFTSKTDQVDISNHGSPTWEDYQTFSPEDRSTREEALRLFGMKSERKPYSRILKSLEGYDGSQHYSGNFLGEPSTDIEDRKKNVLYLVTTRIKKSGALETLSNPCELERFLLERGFELMTD